MPTGILYPGTISECLLFTLLVLKLFNHCLYICFNLETVNLLAHDVPEASHHPTGERQVQIQKMFLKKPIDVKLGYEETK